MYRSYVSLYISFALHATVVVVFHSSLRPETCIMYIRPSLAKIHMDPVFSLRSAYLSELIFESREPVSDPTAELYPRFETSMDLRVSDEFPTFRKVMHMLHVMLRNA